MKGSSPRIAIAVCLLLVGLVALAFGAGARYEFTQYDDPKWVSENPMVQSGLDGQSLSYAFHTTILGHWAPLTVLSHMVACQCFGTPAGAHHLVNIALHGIGTLILFLTLWSMTGAPLRSAVVAAFFAVHPLRVESVMWIAERKDVLSGIFFFLTLWAYTKWARQGGVALYLLVMVFATCGLMSKSMLVTLPFILLLLDFWPLDRWSDKAGWRWRIIEKLPLFGLAATSAVIQYRVISSLLMSAAQLGWGPRLGNALATYGIYVRQLFWPGPLAVFYPHPGMPPWWEILIGATTVLAITGLAWRYGRQQRYLWVGWLWFLGMLVPVIGLVQSGELARADRYTYLPQVGLLIMVVWGVSEACRNLPYRDGLLVGATAVGLVAAVISTRKQAATWRNEESLWSQALAVTQNNHQAHTSLGAIELRRKNYPSAIVHFREAIRIQPNYWRAQANLGMALLDSGEQKGAFEAAGTAVRLNPGETAASFGLAFKTAGVLPAAAWCFREALAARPDDPRMKLELAYVQSRLGALQGAVSLYQSVLKEQPDRLEALSELGQLFAQMGRLDEAVPLIEKALQQKPDDGLCLFALGNIRLRQGQSPAALMLYRSALEKNPDLADAQANLAWLLATSVEDSLRNGTEAVKWALVACHGTGANNPALLRILAAAYAEAAQFPDAISTIEKAIVIAQKQADPNLIGRLQSQRALYEANQPLRVPIRPPGR